MALTHAKLKALVNSKISTYTNDQIIVYKLQSVTADIYRQGTKTFDAGTTVGAIARTKYDNDDIDAIGRVEQDTVYFTIARAELESKFPAIAVRQWVKLEDTIMFENTYYAIDKIKFTGRVFGDFTVIIIQAHENPDLGA